MRTLYGRAGAEAWMPELERVLKVFVHGMIRACHRAFHPNGPQEVLDLDRRVFAVLRTSPEGDERILALVNVAPGTCPLAVSLGACGLPGEGRWCDLITGKAWRAEGGALRLSLEPYEVLWLTPEGRDTALV